MKIGKSLTELAMELERQSSAKTDYIANTSALEMTPNGAGSSGFCGHRRKEVWCPG